MSQDKELEECTFKPRVNNVSRRAARNRRQALGENHLTVDDRLFDESIRRYGSAVRTWTFGTVFACEKGVQYTLVYSIYVSRLYYWTQTGHSFFSSKATFCSVNATSTNNMNTFIDYFNNNNNTSPFLSPSLIRPLKIARAAASVGTWTARILPQSKRRRKKSGCT